MSFMVASEAIRFSYTIPTTMHDDKSIAPQTTFASLNALGPCVVKVGDTSCSTLVEPSTAASATAVSTSISNPALGARETAHCCCR